MMRYRAANSVPGRKRPCEIELEEGDEKERDTFRLAGFEPLGGAGVDVAVANGSEFEDCAEPHEGQKRAPDWISVPHDEQ
jgi:hypothetical protein